MLLAYMAENLYYLTDLSCAGAGANFYNLPTADIFRHMAPNDQIEVTYTGAPAMKLLPLV
jgi:hypothetical protein